MNTKKRLIAITAIFLILIIASAAGIALLNNFRNLNSNTVPVNVQVNAIKHEIEAGNITDAKSKLDDLSKASPSSNESGVFSYLYLLPVGIAGIYVVVVFAYVYKSILRPFDKLHDFAANVAAGDLDAPLNQERGLYFGEFTWAFDNMRKEIKKARDSERESIENNKTVIATLSHDIKTPISSIRSYSEALEANLDKTPEKRSKYLNTIINKCDEVSKLTDDLFIHSVSDMGKMNVASVNIDINQYMKSVLPGLNTFENVYLSADDSKLMVSADPERLLQICENIVGNTNKYAPGRIDIAVTSEGDSAVLTFRDYGNGIPEENLPFITSKFYRGNNTKGIQGSGLGLYIVSYLTTRMNAELSIENVYEGENSKGLKIKISFPKVS